MLILCKEFLLQSLSAATAQKQDTMGKNDQVGKLHIETMSYHFCKTQEHREVACHLKHSREYMAQLMQRKLTFNSIYKLL